jgi:hypothetical protein
MHHGRSAGLRLVATLALAGLAAGCGGPATSDATPQVTTAPTTSTPPEPTPAVSPSVEVASSESVSPVASGTEASTPPVAITDLCTLLTPSDFARFGVDGAGEPEATTDGTGSTYCVYAGTSGATGGIELDLLPNPDETTAHDTFVTATGEGPPGMPATGGGFTVWSFAIDDEVAALVVRQGSLVIALAAPNDINTEQGLVSLAQLVIERADPVLLGTS